METKLDLSRIVWAGVAINFVSFIVGGGSYLIFRWIFEIEPVSIWRWTPAMGFDIPIGWPSLLFMNITLSFIFAGIFAILHGSVPGRGVIKGLAFGVLAWLIGVVPPMITLALMTRIAPTALWYFTLQGLVEWLTYGAVIALIYLRASDRQD